jgi:Fe-S-cluster-containing hydrogenase component 2
MFGFEQLDKILSVIIKDEVSVFEDQCPRVLHRNNKCKICVEVCPQNALRIEDGVSVDLQKCNECGLCVSACPCGVFELNRLSDKDVLRQIKLTLSEESDTDDKAVLFTCDKSQCNSPTASKIAVNCLGRLHDALLLGVVNFGVKNVLLDVGECENCETQALTQIMENVENASAILNSLNKQDFKFKYITAKRGADGKYAQADEIPEEKVTDINGGKDSFKYSRRNFFDHVRKKSIEKSADLVVSSIPLGDDENNDLPIPHRLPTKRLHLIQIMKSIKSKLGKAHLDASTVANDLPFKKIEISEKCQICEFCSKFCPTEAIVRKDDGEGANLHFNSLYCTGCKICVDVCPDKALTVEKNNKLEFGYSLIKFAQLRKCRICGFKFSSEGEGDLCRFCKKKEELAGTMF